MTAATAMSENPEDDCEGGEFNKRRNAGFAMEKCV
jgi:hypothetical protein